MFRPRGIGGTSCGYVDRLGEKMRIVCVVDHLCVCLCVCYRGDIKNGGKNGEERERGGN